MKKIYTCIIFIYSLSCKAQVYQPMLDSVSNTWYFVSNIVPLSPAPQAPANCSYGMMPFANSLIYFTSGDTMMNGNSYKILLEHDYFFPANTCLFGYMREDTAARKIFFVDNIFSAEEVLYDFSMQVGDSINLNFYQPGYYQNGYYTLDSIGTVNIPAGARNIFYLNNHVTPFIPAMEWIESVGHPGHLVYTRSCNSFGGNFSFNCFDKIDRGFCEMLTCFEHANFKVYFDSCAHQNAVNNFCVQYEDSCNYWNTCGAVEELGFVKAFSASPNPARDEIILTVETNKKTSADFILKDISGKEIMISKLNKILPGPERFKLNVRHLETGIYFIECRMKEGSLYRKVVIE